jgi:4-hydroxy-tetrahydrodipicolinate synthase
MSERGWRWERQLHGIIPPLISPLDGAGAPDAGATAALVDHVIGGGCSGLFMLGGCGEGAWLTSTQRGAVVRAAARAAAGRVPVLAGVMGAAGAR